MARDDDRSGAMAVDLAERVLALLRAREQTQGVPTGTLARLGRTALAGARLGLSRLRGRLAGHDEAGLAGLDPETIARLTESLGELKGVAMKIGQILSYIDETLPPESARVLALLQTQSQPTPLAEVEAAIRRELGERAPALLGALEPEPVAVASIGQVHRARLPDGTRVAVKVRHPGIAEALQADFRAARLGKEFARLLAPAGNVAEVMAEAEARFLEECDYALEAERQEWFRGWFAGDPDLLVPRVHRDWSGPGLLVSDWCDGQSFEAFLGTDPPQAVRDRLGAALYRFYLGTLYRHGALAADPHPGNLLFLADGRAAMLDFGCVREFPAADVAALIQLSAAARADEPGALREALVRIGARDPGTAGPDFETARDLVRGFLSPLLEPGPHRMAVGTSLAAREVLTNKRAMLRLNLPPGRLLFLFRIRFGLYAVLARLGAVADWGALEADLARQAGSASSPEASGAGRPTGGPAGSTGSA
ncbi:MAG TPA: AarF/ABC1/UbiB kinase family protein [Polyangia bacterium]|nr:AarF/ABC1/UbiB kinase family protein [Polyangia bacterium]